LLRQLGIGVKAALFVAGVVVVVVIGLTFQGLVTEAVQAQEQTTLRARVRLMQVASELAGLWREGSPVDLTDQVEELSREMRVLTLAVVRRDGVVDAHYGQAPDAREVRRVTALGLTTMPRTLWRFSDEPVELIVAVPIQYGALVRGYVMCAFETDEPIRSLRAMAFDAFLSMAFWAAVGSGLALLVARRLTRPLVELAGSVERLGTSGYVMPPKGPADGEIGVVQARLAELSSGLQAEQTRVSELTAALRHQIEVVTADVQRVAAQRQAILDSVGDAILVVERDGRIVSRNHVGAELFDESSGAFWERFAAPDRVEESIARAIALGRPVMLTAQLPRADGGEPRRCRLRLSPMTHSEGVATAVVVLIEDLSEDAKMEEQMLRSERLAVIGTLTAGLTHQIGNYLNAIKGHADLLARRLKDDRSLSMDLDTIRTEVRSAAELMDKIQILARKSTLRRGPIAPCSVVRETLDLVRTQARHTNVIMEEVYPANCHPIMGDPTLLAQAVLNLVVNALHAMPEGGTLRVVVTDAERPGRPCRIDIADTGHGMSLEVLRSAFDPFFTTKAEGEGTGLGLPITQRIVELHGGTIWVDSKPGDGTIFHIELPTAEPTSSSDGRHVAPSESEKKSA